MKRILFLLLLLIYGFANSQVVPVTNRPIPNNTLDISRYPYNIKAGEDAAVACQAALDSINKMGGGYVIVPLNYLWGRPVVGSQKGARIYGTNVHVIGFGNTLTLTNNCTFFSSDFGTDSLGSTITANTVDSNTVITVASTSGWAAGDTVFGRFNTAPYDAGEPLNFGYFIIKSIESSTQVKLDRPCGATMTVASTSTLNKRLIRIKKLATNCSVEGFNFYNPYTGSAVAEAGIGFQGGWNLTVKNVTGTNMGAGLVAFQFCLNSTISDFMVSAGTTTLNANFGRGFTIDESPGTIIKNGTISNYQGVGIFFEANNPGSQFDNVTFNNTYNDSERIAISSIGSGDLIVSNCKFTGFKQVPYSANLSTGKAYFSNSTVYKGANWTAYEQLGMYIMPWLRIGDTLYSSRRTWCERKLLTVNGNTTFTGPRGRVLNATVNIDDTIGVTALYIRRDAAGTNNGNNLKSLLKPDTSVYLTGATVGDLFAIGAGLTSTKLNYNDDKGVLVVCGSSLPANTYVTITWDYLQADGITLGPENSTSVSGTQPTLWGDITGALANQSDLNTALGLKAPLASPALTGTPTAPTAAVFTANTQIATTAFVDRLSGYTFLNLTSAGNYGVLAQVRYTYVVLDPAAAIGATSVTTPTSPNSGDIIIITAGGQIASGASVCTAFTLTANSGQSIYGATFPVALLGSDGLQFVWDGTSKWRRLKF